MGIAYLAVRHISGLRRTRGSVAAGLSVLRGDGQAPGIGGEGARGSISRDGQQAGIAAREPR